MGYEILQMKSIRKLSSASLTCDNTSIGTREKRVNSKHVLKGPLLISVHLFLVVLIVPKWTNKKVGNVCYYFLSKSVTVT